MAIERNPHPGTNAKRDDDVAKPTLKRRPRVSYRHVATQNIHQRDGQPLEDPVYILSGIPSRHRGAYVGLASS